MSASAGDFFPYLCTGSSEAPVAAGASTNKMACASN